MKVTSIGQRSRSNPSRRTARKPSNGWKPTQASGRSEQNGERWQRLRPEHLAYLNCKEWRQTKAIVKERAKGLCEECRREGQEEGRRRGDPKLAKTGYIVPGVDCHHKIPFESATTPEEMARLCYDPDNVILLCIRHHIAAHTQAKSHTKEAHQQRQDERLERWKARHDRPQGANEKPSGPHLSEK